jgi:phospholipid/cholesterol/gamma-HCH transport system substrate-binding protein
MSRRILLNLVAFAVLGVAMTAWALHTVIRFDALTHPYRINAEFASSPGLQPNFDVTYLGVAVGKIKSVRLGDRRVIVTLDIDRGIHIPEGTSAAAGRKSAIGEPYIDLEPAPGRADDRPMRTGEVIPMARTSVPQSYGDLFTAVNKAVNGLNPDDVSTLTRELAAGLDGRGDSLRQLIDSSSQITGTFARNTQMLNGLIGNLTALTDVLVAHRDDLGNGIDNLASVTGSLASVSTDITRLRSQSPDLLVRLNRILTTSKASDQCLLNALGDALPTLLAPASLDDLAISFQQSPQLIAALTGATPKVNGKSNLNLNFVFSATPSLGPVEYKSLQPLPSIPRIPTCPGVSLPKQQIPPMSAAQRAAVLAETATPPTNASNAAQRSQSRQPGGPPGWLIYIPPLIAAAILISLLGRAVPLLARRRRARKNGDE